jgi:predicted alpha/beta-fold hydrolase
MRRLYDTGEASGSGRDLLASADCLLITGRISTAAASANPTPAVAAPSEAAIALTAQTGTDVRSLTVHANGIRQHYLEAGNGPPVVLLHGFPETSYAWRHQIPVLARHYQVIAPDLRGYGETDKAASGYDKRNMANDLRELMKALEIRKIALVGHDRGARVAIRFEGSSERHRSAGRAGQCPDSDYRPRLRRREGKGILVLSVPSRPRPARGANRWTGGYLAPTLLFGRV